MSGSDKASINWAARTHQEQQYRLSPLDGSATEDKNVARGEWRQLMKVNYCRKM